MDMDKIIVRAAVVTAAAGSLCAIAAGVLYVVGQNDCAAVIGVVSTVISIVLGLVSIGYTYFSGQKMVSTLEQIKAQNRRLVDKINRDMAKDNSDDANIDEIQRMIDEVRQK